MDQKEKTDIKIKSKSSQDQIAQYLVKAVLFLRDRDNKSESVRLFGAGSAIPNAILVAEIVRARFKGLSSIATFENMQKSIEVNENGQTKKIQIAIPAIRIKLTCNPTQEELNQPGYQEPGEVKDEKKFELFPYVMIYAQNLFFSRENKPKQNKQNREDNNKQSNQDRGKLITRGDSHAQRRKPDQQDQKESYRGGSRSRERVNEREQQRNQKNYKPGGRPRPIQNQSNFNLSSQDRENRTKQGEIKTRGGNRK
ncbi:unnamed protein product (macronuclear) [Paramecium tetraurelia]|uniref:DNA/RNA-binding protein Alba-like domain-containing protein n=1 Tax=Paramecium tetraurelia TaxID=5888 RepID=A0DRJ2_PARTE|nr:uncharacterized protein GSPATT00019377001 [Paramecium tetraurelia]CAK85659.1 unnamed protein product [Paramecium tetraurelia]|eukprot:XP_001453056.1 hypothetical protein (macronuclear) [Paramecium tetraurelia strain d4-2]